MSKTGITETVLKAGLTEAIKKDKGSTQTNSGVENGHHVTKWIKQVAKDICDISKI